MNAEKWLELSTRSTVQVRLWNGRTVEGKVSYMEETVGGRKITVVSGSVVHRVNTEQIIEVVKL